jgi:hypothetical protein
MVGRTGITTFVFRLKRYEWVCGTALALCVLLLRGYERVLYADLWGEEGVFLSNALTGGWSVLLLHFTGYFHLFQRTLTLLALHLSPLAKFPHLLSFSCIFSVSLILGRFASPSYRWLVPSDVQRLILVACLAMLPGYHEMLGNLPNLNWFLHFAVALIGLKDPKEPITKLELVFVALAILSTGTTVLLLPLFVWRAFETKSRQSLLVAIAIGLSAVVLSFLERPGHIDLQVILPNLLHTFVRITLSTFFYQPWLGDWITTWLYHHAFWEGLIRPVVFLLILWGVMKLIRRQLGRALLFFVLPGLTWPVLSWISRDYLLGFFQSHPELWFWETHYALPSAFMAVLFWAAIASNVQSYRIRNTLCTLLVLSIFTNGALRFKIPAYGHLGHWEKNFSKLEQSLKTGCPSTVRFEIYPHHNFIVNYSSQKADCP